MGLTLLSELLGNPVFADTRGEVAFHDSRGVAEKSEADRHKFLWASVLIENWRVALGEDAFGNKSAAFVKPVHCAQAREWFGSDDFCDVCDLANVDPELVYRAYLARLAVMEVAAKNAPQSAVDGEGAP